MTTSDPSRDRRCGVADRLLDAAYVALPYVSGGLLTVAIWGAVISWITGWWIPHLLPSCAAAGLSGFYAWCKIGDAIERRAALALPRRGAT